MTSIPQWQRSASVLLVAETILYGVQELTNGTSLARRKYCHGNIPVVRYVKFHAFVHYIFVSQIVVCPNACTRGSATMKDIMDPLHAGEIGEKENFANRKLIRPTLPRAENHGNHNSAPMQSQERRERPERYERAERGDRGMAGKKPAPPEQTNAENFYYQKQMQSRTQMVIVLHDGEEVHGIIEWYDKNCLKVNRNDGEPNLMIYKPAIKYMYKEGENQR